jgi:hypothetical protein
MTHPTWPTTAAELIDAQHALAAATPRPWVPGCERNPLAVGAAVVVVPRHRAGP